MLSFICFNCKVVDLVKNINLRMGLSDFIQRFILLVLLSFVENSFFSADDTRAQKYIDSSTSVSSYSSNHAPFLSGLRYVDQLYCICSY